MPTKPKTFCRHPGCGTLLAESGYCTLHKPLHDKFIRADYSADRKDRQVFYVSAKWRRLRARHLHSEPLCRRCKSDGRFVQATVVDHIFRFVNTADPLAIDPSNLQSLCDRCHNSKSAKERAQGGSKVKHK